LKKHTASNSKHTLRGIALDIDTEGLHAITSPPNQYREADIVFVHGLGGASHSTWRYGKVGDPNHFFWPEALGEDLPKCKVWTVGYPAGITELGKPGMIIEKRAGNLSQKLANAGLGEIPIVFVTHSMGGLVIKSLLVGSQLHADDDRRRIARMVRGIVFCATPHRGSNFANAAQLLGKFFGGAQPHVREMRANEDAIDILNDEFIEWHRQNPIAIASYAENVGLFRKNLLGRTVPIGLVVPRASANTGIAGFTVIDVDEDHLSIVKPPNRQHDVYAGVLRFIEAALKAPPAEKRAGASPGETRPSKQIFYEPPSTETHLRLIGRDDQIDSIVEGLCTDRQDKALVYLPGVGKTRIANEIAKDRRLREHFDGILWIDVGKDTDPLPEFKKLATALDIDEKMVSELKNYEAFKAILKARIGDKRMLLILDDIWKLEAKDKFMGLGPRCTYLLTTRDRKVASQLATETVVIPPLDEKRSKELLEATAESAMAYIAQNEKLSKSLNQIIDNLEGLPLALIQVGKHLRTEYAEGNTFMLESALSSFEKLGVLFKQNPTSEEVTEGLSSVLDIQYESLSHALQHAYLALSVFRPNPQSFTLDMAERICNVDIHMLTALSNTGLVDYVQPKEKNAHTNFSIHRVLSEYAYQKLSKEERIGIHRRAVMYYEEEIQKLSQAISGGDTLSYKSWYRYENPEWQHLQQDRLYHLGHSDMPWAVANAILRIYFDAFWWWGYYQPFAFCDTLVDHWQQRVESEPIQKILAELAAFRTNYPSGYEKRDKPGWTKVKNSLLNLQTEARLDRPPEELDMEQRHIRGLMDFFLAEAYAYAETTPGQDNIELAMKTFESARATFEALGDAWNDCWILFYMADLIADTDAPRALEYCHRSIKIAEAAPLHERDPEILGNVYRLLGDIRANEADYDAAAKHYGRASFYAYAFQVIPNSMPDDYTIAFYREITERIAKRVHALLSKDPTQGKAFWNSLRAYWEPYRGASNAAETEIHSDAGAWNTAKIASNIFPILPSLEQIKVDREKFLNEVNRVVALA
jgi:hypothetical protein